MANSYATIASGGIHCEPIAILEIKNSNGEEQEIPKAGCERVLDEDVAATTAYALKSNTTAGSGRVFGRLNDGRDAGIKTGTTDGPTDLWNVVITTGLVSAVWVGNAQSTKPISNMSIGGKYSSIWYGSSLVNIFTKSFFSRAIAFYSPGNFSAPSYKLMGTSCTFLDKKKCDQKVEGEVDQYGKPIEKTDSSQILSETSGENSNKNTDSSSNTSSSFE